jgi:ribosomal subunit interface protein
MIVRFTGRHVGIPDEDRAWAEAKVEALGRFHRLLRDLEVRVTVVDGSSLERVELEARYGRRRTVARADAHSFREALDDACESLRRQLQKDKEKGEARRRPSRRAGASR